MSMIITFSRMPDSVQRIFAKDCGASPITFGTPWRHGGGPADAGPGSDLREAYAALQTVSELQEAYEDGLTDTSFTDCEGLCICQVRKAAAPRRKVP